jgi:DNA-binding transcriptional ArsR family regulator
MALDLLSTIRREIDERLSELRPLLAEQEQLLVAAGALERTTREAGSEDADIEPSRKTGAPARGTRAQGSRRGSAAGTIARAAAIPASEALNGRLGVEDASASQRGRSSATKSSSVRDSKPARAARGAAREAILAALDHGSHTVGELAVVTAMSVPNINGNLRRLLVEKAVVKTEREGKLAWALADAA